VITDTCQRWTLGRESRRPAGETIRAAEYEVASIGPTHAKAFVETHHYSGSCSPTMRPFGLFRRGELAGVAVFGPLPSENAHRAVFPTLATAQGLTLGRLVLLESVPGNGESFFVARCFDQLARDHGVIAVESCADPVPRHAQDGRTIHRGHVGTIYQSLNGRFVGRTNPASLRLLPDGSVLSNRTQGKLVRGERGQSTAIAQLVRFGAPAPSSGEDLVDWLRTWRAQLTRPLRHAGNFRYLWCLDRRRRREVLETRPQLPYPKMHA